MIYTQEDLFKLILETRALSIWNRAKGPIFWYAANVPGPFYLNTEMMIGADLSSRMLREITAIVAGTIDTQVRANQLNTLILDAYKTSKEWQSIIATMIDRASHEWDLRKIDFISGGERRDWLFSIPFAHDANLPHLFLFKNHSTFCTQTPKSGQNVLHVSDLINNAASFFDSWQPILSNLGLHSAGNLCVNLRGTNGLKRLREAGQKTVPLVTIDIEFFRHLHAADLIDRATFEEISIFFASIEDWATKYLIGNEKLFDVAGTDAKSFERLRYFFTNDPWKLRGKHGAFFASMEKAIEQRIAKAA